MTELEKAKKVLEFSSQPAVRLSRLYFEAKHILGIEIKDKEILKIFHLILKFSSNHWKTEIEEICAPSVPSSYELRSKELDTSDNIVLFKVIGNGGSDSFYIKMLSYEGSQFCKPIIPKKYYRLLPEYLAIDNFIKNYAPIVDVCNAASFWAIFITNNFNIEFRGYEVINLGIKKQSEMKELWE